MRFSKGLLRYDRAPSQLTGVIVGGLLTVLGALSIDVVREFWIGPVKADKQLKWMLSLDAEHLSQSIEQADEIRSAMSDWNESIRLAMNGQVFWTHPKFFWSFDDTDYYKRYESFHSKISDRSARRIITLLSRYKTGQQRLKPIADEARESLDEAAKNKFNPISLALAMDPVNALSRMILYAKEQDIYVLYLIQQYLGDSGTVVMSLPYEFTTPSREPKLWYVSNRSNLQTV